MVDGWGIAIAREIVRCHQMHFMGRERLCVESVSHHPICQVGRILVHTKSRREQDVADSHAAIPFLDPCVREPVVS